MSQKSDEGLRVDRWLWAIRLFKTRQLASTAIKGGKVSLNGQRPKPSRLVHPGDELIVTKEGFRYHIRVTGLADKRVSAPIAATLYEESEQSIAARADRAAQMKAGRLGMVQSEGRPTKRNRRILDDFKRNT